jgi:HK97 family phage major capsid protein
MLKLLELRRKRTEKVDEARGILDAAEAENRDLTEDEETRYNALMDEIRAIKKKEEREVELGSFTPETRENANEPTMPDPAESRVHVQGDGPFNSLGEQLMAVVRASSPGGTVDPRLHEVRAASGLNEAVDSEGGFMVQKDFISELVKDTYDTGVVAKMCRKIPIGANSNGTVLNGIDETSRASSRWGGIIGYWANEADTVSDSKPKFRQIKLNLNKLMGLCYATDENLADYRQLEAVVKQGFSEEFGFKLDDAVINGDGTGKPLGVLSAGCLVTQPKESGQNPETIVTKNLLKMWTRLIAKSRSKAVWLINQEIEPQLDELTVTIGTGGVLSKLYKEPVGNSPYGTIKGRPVIAIEQCAALGTVGDIILGDFSQYLLADKGAMEAAQSIHVRFLYGENTFRFTYRVDGQPVRASTLTPYKGSANQSHFVALATRS